MYILNYLILNSRGRLFELRVPRISTKNSKSFFLYYQYTSSLLRYMEKVKAYILYSREIAR